VKLQRDRLLAQGRGGDLELLEKQIRTQIVDSMRLAEAAPYPQPEDIFQDLFS
jgi:TPP-dependent pyruvate/acetoin dehydrogenase alpha subunit